MQFTLQASTEADLVAVEQIMFWFERGVTPKQALDRVGFIWTKDHEPSWRHVQFALAQVWASLGEKENKSESKTQISDVAYPAANQVDGKPKRRELRLN